jgi:hypothetical protein
VPSSKNRRRLEVPDWLYLTIEWIARAEGRTVSDTAERLLFEGILRLYSRGDPAVFHLAHHGLDRTPPGVHDFLTFSAQDGHERPEEDTV